MKNSVKKNGLKDPPLIKTSGRFFIMGVAFIFLILSAASGYLFLENQELDGKLNLIIDQKSLLDAEVPDPVLKYAPLLVGSNDPDIRELAVSLGGQEEIYYFVRDNIDYSEDYDERRMATEVLRTGQGDCLGKANLLAGLLIAYGYSSGDVMVSMGYVTINGEKKHHAWVEYNSNGKWLVLDSSQFLGNFEFNRWERISFYEVYKARPYAKFNDMFVQVDMKVKT